MFLDEDQQAGMGAVRACDSRGVGGKYIFIRDILSLRVRGYMQHTLQENAQTASQSSPQTCYRPDSWSIATAPSFAPSIKEWLLLLGRSHACNRCDARFSNSFHMTGQLSVKEDTCVDYA